MERWFKDLDDFGTKFGVAGLALIGIGNYFNWAPLMNLGLAALGAGIVAWGANMIQRRELAIWQRGIPLSARLDELVAQAWGLVTATGGILLFGFGILALLNPRAPIPLPVRQFFDTAQGRGALLLAGSFVGVIFGLSLLLAEGQARNPFVCLAQSLPNRVFGVLILMVCLTLAVIALLQIFAPGAWEMLAAWILHQLGF
jgi:hypothetical protein